MIFFLSSEIWCVCIIVLYFFFEQCIISAVPAIIKVNVSKVLTILSLCYIIITNYTEIWLCKDALHMNECIFYGQQRCSILFRHLWIPLRPSLYPVVFFPSPHTLPFLSGGFIYIHRLYQKKPDAHILVTSRQKKKKKDVKCLRRFWTFLESVSSAKMDSINYI